jgi:hypothetical protein
MELWNLSLAIGSDGTVLVVPVLIDELQNGLSRDMN